MVDCFQITTVRINQKFYKICLISFPPKTFNNICNNLIRRPSQLASQFDNSYLGNFKDILCVSKNKFNPFLYISKSL